MLYNYSVPCCSDSNKTKIVTMENKKEKLLPCTDGQQNLCIHCQVGRSTRNGIIIIWQYNKHGSCRKEAKSWNGADWSTEKQWIWSKGLMCEKCIRHDWVNYLGNQCMTCTNSLSYFEPSTWQCTRKILIDNNVYSQSFYSNSILYVSTTIKCVISQIIYIVLVCKET